MRSRYWQGYWRKKFPKFIGRFYAQITLQVCSFGGGEGGWLKGIGTGNLRESVGFVRNMTHNFHQWTHPQRKDLGLIIKDWCISMF